ncbi:hypothetical protein LUM37_02795 [Bacillus subtilis]|nr:hypothetical protein LUM37_02795 [Bacillus subtilis]
MSTEVEISKKDLETIKDIKRSLLQKRIDQLKGGKIKSFESKRDDLLEQIATVEVDIICTEQQPDGINKKNHLEHLNHKVDVLYKNLNNHYFNKPIDQYDLVEKYEKELKKHIN